MKIVGLDFETANYRHGSICAAGLAVMEDGIMTEKREWLVRPHKSMDYVLPRFTAVHGITYYDLRQSPEFPEIWPVMRDILKGADCVAIHNAGFDLLHWKNALALYGLPRVSLPYICTLELSRKKLPELESHSLDAVAGHFGIAFCHHDALEEAAVCVTVASLLNFDENMIKRFDFAFTQS